MKHIPVTILFFTSSKEHFGFKDIYLAALNDLARQIPLGHFAGKVAHVKISNGHETRGEEMRKELESRGFKVLTTTEDWSRGTSHQEAYLRDQIKVSKELSVYQTPYVLFLEDDSTLTPHKSDLEAVLARMIRLLESSPDILSARFLRAGDLDTSPILSREVDYFWSEHFNFQPAILRSRDFYIITKLLEDNLHLGGQIQIEMFWRLVMQTLSRADKKHMVWLPEYAETIHLGTPEFPALAKKLGLT